MVTNVNGNAVHVSEVSPQCLCDGLPLKLRRKIKSSSYGEKESSPMRRDLHQNYRQADMYLSESWQLEYVVAMYTTHSRLSFDLADIKCSA